MRVVPIRADIPQHVIELPIVRQLPLYEMRRTSERLEPTQKNELSVFPQGTVVDPCFCAVVAVPSNQFDVAIA
jgi:hypothetical protein